MGFLLNDSPNGPGFHPELPAAPEPGLPGMVHPGLIPHEGLASAISAITGALGFHGDSFRQRLLDQQVRGTVAPTKNVLGPEAVQAMYQQIPQRTAGENHSNLLGLFQRAGHQLPLNPQHQPQLNPFQGGGSQY